VSTPSPARTGLSRRTAVGVGAAGAAVALGGCTPRGIDRRPKRGRPRPTRAAGVDPDVALAATVLRDEQGLLDRVLATLQRHPRLEAELTTARSAHQAHVSLLRDAVPDDLVTPSPSGSSPSPSVSASAPASVSPPPAVAVPRRPPAALAAVARAEERLALVGRRSAFAARSGAFARVLASMAASASQQAATLGSAARDRR
jgi:hypothetical protein